MRNFGVCVVAAVALAGCSKTPPCEDEIGAFVAAQQFIRQELLSPSTAEFPYISAEGNRIYPLTWHDGRCVFTIRTFVDAQNAFGGTVRQKFSVTVTPILDQPDRWTLVSIQPEGGS